MSQSDPRHESESQLPEGLRRALLDLHTPTSRIPADIDHAILARAAPNTAADGGCGSAPAGPRSPLPPRR